MRSTDSHRKNIEDLEVMKKVLRVKSPTSTVPYAQMVGGWYKIKIGKNTETASRNWVAKPSH